MTSYGSLSSEALSTILAPLSHHGNEPQVDHNIIPAVSNGETDSRRLYIVSKLCNDSTLDPYQASKIRSTIDTEGDTLASHVGLQKVKSTWIDQSWRLVECKIPLTEELSQETIFGRFRDACDESREAKSSVFGHQVYRVGRRVEPQQYIKDRQRCANRYARLDEASTQPDSYESSRLAESRSTNASLRESSARTSLTSASAAASSRWFARWLQSSKKDVTPGSLAPGRHSDNPLAIQHTIVPISYAEPEDSGSDLDTNSTRNSNIYHGPYHRQNPSSVYVLSKLTDLERLGPSVVSGIAPRMEKECDTLFRDSGLKKIQEYETQDGWRMWSYEVPHSERSRGGFQNPLNMLRDGVRNLESGNSSRGFSHFTEMAFNQTPCPYTVYSTLEKEAKAKSVGTYTGEMGEYAVDDFPRWHGNGNAPSTIAHKRVIPPKRSLASYLPSMPSFGLPSMFSRTTKSIEIQPKSEKSAQSNSSGTCGKS